MPPSGLHVAHLDFDGNTIAEFEHPASLRWSYSIGSAGPGKVSYALAERDPGVTRDGFGPKRTDIAVRDDAGELWSGFCWSYNFRFSGETIAVAGNDWLEWLNQPPLGLWDYTVSVDGLITPVDLSEVTDVQQMVLFFNRHRFTTWNLEMFLNELIAPTQFNPAEQVALYTSMEGDAFAMRLYGWLQRSSQTTVLQLINDLAQMGAPFGFDFFAEADRTLRFIGPRRTNPASVSPTYGFYTSGNDIVDGDFTNNGPEATEILFTEGQGNVSRYWHKEHQPSIDQFRRWGKVVALDGGQTETFSVGGGQVSDRDGDGLPDGTPPPNGDDGEFKAQAAQNRMMFPQRELTLTIRPDEGFGYTNRLMEAVDVDWEKYDGSFHRVDSYWWVTSQTYYISDEGPAAGEWLCDLTLDQINSPISGTGFIPEEE